MIFVEAVRKRFGPVVAVDGLSFEVRRGEVVGLLGPNGAGKTTTMKMLTGTLQPDEGTVQFDGAPISADLTAAKRRVGYLPEANPLYDDMIVSEHLAYVCDLHGLSGPESRSGSRRGRRGDGHRGRLLPPGRRALEGVPAACRAGGRDPARARDPRAR